MSKLVHPCTTCTHPQNHHERIAGEQAYTGCPCCRAAGFDGDPTPIVTETFDLATHQPEPLWAPGEWRNGGTGHKEQLCGCEACRAAYAELAG